ncbi:polysaccharide deacetylase family protein [Oligoflexia bacterium]|nr:polysaccharide deacetylase family protein [Oligoflexia bacterium]
MANVLPRSVKNGIKYVLQAPPLEFVRRYYRGLGTCLMYHSISTEEAPVADFCPNIELAVRAENFEEQIQLLAKNYVCLSLEQALGYLKQNKLLPNTVIITFDDGYKDNLQVALPILEKYGVPATIYISTGLVDRTCQLWWYEHEFILQRLNSLEFEWEGQAFAWSLESAEQKLIAFDELNLMFKALNHRVQEQFMNLLRNKLSERFSYDDLILTWDEVRELDQHPLITIGAHTTRHSVLSRLSERELKSELEESRQKLESQLEHAVAHFAYPFGEADHVGPKEFHAVQNAGFHSAFTTRSGHLHAEHKDHLFALPRIAIDYNDTIEKYKWKLSGLEALVQRKGKRLVTI